jgi:hypothetical protein
MSPVFRGMSVRFSLYFARRDLGIGAPALL